MCQPLRGLLLLLQFLLLILFSGRFHFAFLSCFSATASIEDWLQCIGNEKHIWIYLVVRLFQTNRPCHICNGAFSLKKWLNLVFVLLWHLLKAKSRHCCCLLCFSSASQQNRKVNYNFRVKWLDWHTTCLVYCCKVHAKERLQMSNTRLWIFNLCKIWWIDIPFQNRKMSPLIFWSRVYFCFSDNGNWALMDICGRHWISDINFWYARVCLFFVV